jgi:hypothetical protein
MLKVMRSSYLVVTAKVIPSSPNVFTPIMVGICSPELSVLTSVTRRNTIEGGILHSHRCVKLKSHIALSVVET